MAELSAALSRANVGIWERHLAAGHVRVSDGFLALVDCEAPRSELTEEAFLSLRHPDDCERDDQAWAAHVQGETSAYVSEVRLRAKSGTWVWLAFNGAVAERDNEGRPVKVIGTSFDISAYKRKEQQLTRDKDLMSQAMRMGRLGYYYRVVETDEVYWAPETYGLLGLDPDNAAPGPERILEVAHPNDRGILQSTFKDHSWTEMERQFRIILPEGEIRYLRGQVVRERDKLGNIIGSYGIYQDITPFREMQSALLESEARFRAVFEISGAGITISDEKGSIRYINTAFADLLGYRVGELIGRTFKSLSPPSEPDPVTEFADQMREGLRDSLSIEKRYLRKDGRIVWVRLSLNVTGAIAAGEPMFIGVAQDISDRIEAEHRLNESQDLLKEAQRLGKIGHWAWIPETNEVEWSDQMYRILGLDPAEPRLPMTPYGEFVHPDDRAAFDRAVENLIQGAQQESLEYRIVRPDGSVRYVSGRSVVEHPSRGLRRVVGTVQDLTDRRRSEEALQDAIDKAEAANRAKSKFLASMSHELRTPLNAILGFAQLLSLKTKGPLNESQHSYVDNIVQGGEHLLGLINDVLDLARIDAGQLTVRIEPVCAGDVIERVMRSFQQLAADRSVTLEIEEASDQQLAVRADSMRLTQVLVNLTSNAIKYNRPGGSVRFAIATTTDRFGRITVSDTGRGIPEDRHGEVFESFNRLGVDAEGEEGTGIGLTLSKSLVEQMNGQIGFDSRVGRGSRFWVDLPLSADVPAGAASKGT